MSLDKAIKHGKEKRRQYTGARAIDPSCRNHGSCDWCRANRLHASKVQNEIADAKRESRLLSYLTLLRSRLCLRPEEVKETIWCFHMA